MPGDTELSRYQVFLQEKDGQPYQDVGSVHAADAEMALLNARDVFVRRPECVSLWVVPAGAVYARTAQGIAERGVGDVEPDEIARLSGAKVETEAYFVFCKARPAGTHTLVGEFQAASPAEALRQALAQLDSADLPFSWWVLPASQVTCSTSADFESLFEPALDKRFRMSTDFHTLTAMRRIKHSEK